jgi:4-amino-4-deoxy-L-arabinose transferase-like glycosyltransferase
LREELENLDAQSENCDDFSVTWIRRAVQLLMAAFLVRLLLIALTPLDLSADEAHYWEWSRRLDLAYYSKGPLVAYVIALSRTVFGDTDFAVRAPAALLSLFSGLVLFGFLREITSPKVSFIGLVIYLSAPIVTAMGLLMTTDPLLQLFWLLSLYFAARVITSARAGWWIPALVCVGLAALSKYTALILYPSFALFLLTEKALRKQLLSAGWVTGSAALLLTLIPVVIWNAEHGWVNAQHNASHLGAFGFHFRPKYFFELLGAQFGVMGPLTFAGLLYLLKLCVRDFRILKPLERLFFLSAAPLLAVCLAVSMTKSVYANWPMPVLLSGILIFCALLSRAAILPVMKNWQTVFTWTVKANVLISLLACLLFAGFTFRLPLEMLPSKKLTGWQNLAGGAEQAIANLKADFIAAQNYDYASALSFYMAGHPRLYCLTVDGRRMNQYDVWGGWSALEGKDGFLVLKDKESLNEARKFFTAVDEIGEWSDSQRHVIFALGKGYRGGEMALPQKR